VRPMRCIYYVRLYVPGERSSLPTPRCRPGSLRPAVFPDGRSHFHGIGRDSYEVAREATHRLKIVQPVFDA
jgi:hypothetical protein